MVVLLEVPETPKGTAAVEINRSSLRVVERSTRTMFQTHAKHFFWQPNLFTESVLEDSGFGRETCEYPISEFLLPLLLF
jgi:hypothetical protein